MFGRECVARGRGRSGAGSASRRRSRSGISAGRSRTRRGMYDWNKKEPSGRCCVPGFNPRGLQPNIGWHRTQYTRSAVRSQPQNQKCSKNETIQRLLRRVVEEQIPRLKDRGRDAAGTKSFHRAVFFPGVPHRAAYSAAFQALFFHEPESDVLFGAAHRMRRARGRRAGIGGFTTKIGRIRCSAHRNLPGFSLSDWT